MKHLLTLILCLPLMNLVWLEGARGQAASTLHPEKVIGNANCEKCHGQELLAWKSSSHSRSDSVHRDAATAAKAKEIATKMGIDVSEIPSHPLCTECHFTRQQEGSSLRVIGGVSCESCHGGAKDYVDVHGNKEGIPDQATRRAKSKEAGMLYPHEIYKVAENCFNCHLIRDEKLVNVGGHPARSEGFNLVSWTQGEVRHRFYDASFNRVEDKNLETPIERKRLFLVIGMMLDLKYSLQGLARGEQKGSEFPYRQAMGKRAYAILNAEFPAVLGALGGESAPPELVEASKIITVGDLGKEPAVLEAAITKLEAQIHAFGEKYDGSTLGGLDNFLPSNAKGTVYQP